MCLQDLRHMQRNNPAPSEAAGWYLHCRRRLVNWVANVCTRFSLKSLTVHVAVQHMDRGENSDSFFLRPLHRSPIHSRLVSQYILTGYLCPLSPVLDKSDWFSLLDWLQFSSRPQLRRPNSSASRWLPSCLLPRWRFECNLARTNMQ